MARTEDGTFVPRRRSRRGTHLPMSASLRSLPYCALAGLFLLSLPLAQAQEIFFVADFEDGSWPAGFELGPEVERLTAEGASTGEFVPAWRIGTAAEANEGAFFPVPEGPVGNRFAMANDDAPPCNCAMQDVRLTLALPSFVDRSNVALECRIFQDGNFGGGPARVEARVGAGSWIQLATLPVQEGAWQPVVVNLTAFDGLADVQVRFRWSDNGQWATGFAVDDIVLRERLPHDLAVERVVVGDALASPFDAARQSLAYTLLPLEQAGPQQVTSVLVNQGTSPVDGILVSASAVLDGVPQTSRDSLLSGTLLPGERRTVVLPLDWAPSGNGTVTMTITAAGTGQDDDPTNNEGTAVLRITGPGWDAAYGAMALDQGQLQGRVGNDRPFIVANRMELGNPGSMARGVSTTITSNTSLGAQVRAILLDADLAFVDTSMRHTITQEDLDRAWNGEPLYLAFSGTPELSAGDHFAGLQKLEGPGDVFVGLSGLSPVGASLFMQGLNFEVDYLAGTPMVRLHVNDLGVGWSERSGQDDLDLALYPVPVKDEATLRTVIDQPGRFHMAVLDATGRAVMQQDLGLLASGEHRLILNTRSLPTGIYLVQLTGDGARRQLRFNVVR